MGNAQTVVQTILERQTEGDALQRGLVLTSNPDGSVVILRDEREIPCDVLQTSGQPLHLGRGESVLVWLPAGERFGLVLGRIGPSHNPELQEEDIPEELVLEASENLTLKCGEGTITLRSDGKILIKGKDLVAHAKRTNRIKGGSVAIN
jgi:hypothetical protein